MKANEFRQLIDHEFAQLEWTDAQRLHTLRQMKKEERPIMKRKLHVALIVTFILLTLSGTALAAGLNVSLNTESKSCFNSFKASNIIS